VMHSRQYEFAPRRNQNTTIGCSRCMSGTCVVTLEHSHEIGSWNEKGNFQTALGWSCHRLCAQREENPWMLSPFHCCTIPREAGSRIDCAILQLRGLGPWSNADGGTEVYADRIVPREREYHMSKLPCNTTIWYEHPATASLWLEAGASKAHASS